MSQEPTPEKPNETPAAQNPGQTETELKEAAHKAQELAKQGLAKWKALDLPAQIYLGGLAAAFLCALIFDVATVKINMGNGALGAALGSMGGIPRSAGTASAFDYGGNGKLAVLAALAGIGIWIWNFKSAKKEPWVPMALAGCAGLSALLFLILMFRMSGGQGSEIARVEISMNLLGFWLPFAGAIAATVVSVKKLLASA